MMPSIQLPWRPAALACLTQLVLAACTGGSDREPTAQAIARDTTAVETVASGPAPALPPMGPAFAAVSVGESHTCGVTQDQRAYCWGNNEFGQLGDGSPTESSAIPVPVAGEHPFTRIASGQVHTCALDPDGVTYCWGWNGSGEVGAGALTEEPIGVPSRVTGPRFREIAAGGSHTCGLDPEGIAYCWGRNHRGQLGTGTAADAAAPVLVAGDLRFAHITAGETHTCAVTPDGDAHCWGDERFGALGTGAPATHVNTPAPVTGDLRFEQLSAGWGTTCGRTADGAAYCWGRNEFGQAGSGRTDAIHPSPERAVPKLTVQSIATSGAHACALDANDALHCWGANPAPDWPLGTATVMDNCASAAGNATVPCSPRPVSVAPNLRFRAVSTGAHSCAIGTDGTLHCWGANAWGEVGIGTRRSVERPSRVNVSR